jgi:hypothetical protein
MEAETCDAPFSSAWSRLARFTSRAGKIHKICGFAMAHRCSNSRRHCITRSLDGIIRQVGIACGSRRLGMPGHQRLVP